MKKYILVLALALGMVSCQSGRDYFPKNMDKINVEIVRFDNALLNIRPDSSEVDIKKLYSDYEYFMNIYVEDILGLYLSDTAELGKLFANFLTDTTMGFAQTNAEAKKQFADIKHIENELNEGFTRLHYLYPELEIPTIYLIVSGFNASIYSYENIIAVGTDMYLGGDYKYYNQVVYNYQKPTMDKVFMAGDVLNYYISQNIPYTSKNNRLLEHMLFRGKQMYLLEQLMPKSPKWEVIGYTKEQWDWCVKWEKEIWNKIMDKRDLFKTESMIITSYLNDGPFTTPISQDSPGRLGIWVGWQIIDSYMRHNEDVTLQELMKDGDAQKILEKSFYKP
jgi:hypothetical protein